MDIVSLSTADGDQEHHYLIDCFQKQAATKKVKQNRLYSVFLLILTIFKVIIKVEAAV